MGARLFKRPLALGLCAVALLAPTWSCLDATEIDVQISTDEAIANIAAPQQAQILVGTPADVLTTPTTDITSNAVDGNGSFGDLVVAPNGDIGADVALDVVLGVTVPTSQCTQTPQGCIFASRTIRYVSHHRLVLPVKLESVCLGKVCPTGLTCVGGNCVDETVDPSLCDGGTCGPGSLGDGSVIDDATVDAPIEASTCAVTNPGTCGTDTCVDLMSDPANCGRCNFDCIGGTCSNGTCQLTTPSTGVCLGVWNGSVYVIDQKGVLYTLPKNGGKPSPVNLAGDIFQDVTTLGEGADLALSYTTAASSYEVDEKANAHSGSTVLTPADRIALDGTGLGWISLGSGRAGYSNFVTATQYVGLGSTNYTKGWLSVASGILYASVGANTLYRATSTGPPTFVNGTTVPPLYAPTGVAVSDPTSATPSVYVVESGTTVVKLDSMLSSPTQVASGGTSMEALVWDQGTSQAYAISGGAIFKSSNGNMNVLVQAPNAVPRCLVVDADAVYWLEATGVYKHFK